MFVALLILVGVPLTSYEEVKATGVEEYLYYTYWDLMNSLYAMTGYDMKISENEIKNHGVSGKQAWKNFTSFVDNTAKIHWKLYSDAGSSALKELKNLVNTVTQKGISISQDLYDMLKDVFGYQSKYSNQRNQFDCSSKAKVYDFLVSTLGCANYKNLDYLDSVASKIYADHSLLSVFVESSGYAYVLLDIPENTYFGSGATDYYTAPLVYLDSGVEKVLYCDSVTVNPSSCEILERKNNLGVRCNAGAYWLVKNGAFTGADVISSQVSAGACPKEVPDVSPWIKHTDVPDEWRIVKPDEVPDPDDDNDGDALPVVIPIHPAKPDKPSETETEESTEKPDKDKSKDPSVIINPSTGNQIDPNTGLDIDPDTGYLIDPDTGDLIDPNTGKRLIKIKLKTV